ncbi:MAG: hypothetical protein Q9163_003608 [Psora crenata]
MPPARSMRQRIITNENEENKSTTRLTRAKAAASTGPHDVAGGMVKKPLAAKKSASNVPTKTVGQKRAALGDVSNVTKNEAIDSKENKKPMTAKPGLVSKAQSAGVQKLSRNNSHRSILGAKDNNKNAANSELKRPASGSGVMGGAVKKRNTGSTSSQQAINEEEANSENEPPKKLVTAEVKQTVATEVKIEVKKGIAVEDPYQQDDVKQAFEEGVADLDAEDVEDPAMVAEYVVEIFDYLKTIEQSTMPNPDYMDYQTHIEWELRGVLVDWLVEVHTRFNLLPETIFLAVNIVDRFLSARIVELEKLQLVGVTAMFIASKYEEVLSPHVQNFKQVADDGFTEEEILKAERFVLATLNYNLSYPNPMNFLRRISKADNYDIQTRTLGKYLLEISLLDHRFMGYQPSHVAAASMYLARVILDRGEWGAILAHYSGYTEEEIQPVFKLLIDYLQRPITHEAFFKKYASKRFLKASILTRQWAIRNYQMYVVHDIEPRYPGGAKSRSGYYEDTPR